MPFKVLPPGNELESHAIVDHGEAARRQRHALAVDPGHVIAGTDGPDDPAVADAQCLLALGQLGSAEDEAARQAGMMGAQYYLGRLDGRAVADLEGLLRRAAAAMKAEELGPTLQRCGALMQERGQALQAIGDRMIKDGAAQ